MFGAERGLALAERRLSGAKLRLARAERRLGREDRLGREAEIKIRALVADAIRSGLAQRLD